MTTTPHAELPAHMVFIDQYDDSTFGSITDDAWGRDESSELKLGAPLYTAGQMRAYADARERALLARLGEQQPVAEWVQGRFGNYPHLKWSRGHVAKVGDKLYAHPPAAQPAGRWTDADEVDALVRRLDVALNGEAGAAKQASLCDLVSQAEARAAAQPVVQGEREAILRAAVAAMPHANPLVADDLIEGHTMHTEADDIIAIWRASRSSAQGAAQVPQWRQVLEDIVKLQREADFHKDLLSVSSRLSQISVRAHIALSAAPLTECAANREGDCRHAQCPQLRDGEPHKSGRHCPLDRDDAALHGEGDGHA